MKRKMLKFDPELSAHLEEKIRAYGYDAAKKKMFGHVVYFINGYIFTGANEQGIFVHLGAAARDRALKEEKGTVPFEPIEGTIMREYPLLKKQVHTDSRKLKKWLDRASRYLDSLPPKKK